MSDAFDDYLKITLALEAAAEKYKDDMVESGIDDWMHLIKARKQLVVLDGVVVWAATAQPFDKFMEEKGRETFRNYFMPTVDIDLAVRAFGDSDRGIPANLTLQAQIAKEQGIDFAQNLARRFGTTFGSLKVGRPPISKDDSDPKNNPAAKISNNPWLGGIGADGKPRFNISKQGAIIRSLGIERASQIARAAGSYIGATKPSREA
jgi:hypothetical protein